jgi:hypothetical protein
MKSTCVKMHGTEICSTFCPFYEQEKMLNNVPDERHCKHLLLLFTLKEVRDWLDMHGHTTIDSDYLACNIGSFRRAEEAYGSRDFFRCAETG